MVRPLMQCIIRIFCSVPSGKQNFQENIPTDIFNEDNIIKFADNLPSTKVRTTATKQTTSRPTTETADIDEDKLISPYYSKLTTTRNFSKQESEDSFDDKLSNSAHSSDAENDKEYEISDNDSEDIKDKDGCEWYKNNNKEILNNKTEDKEDTNNMYLGVKAILNSRQTGSVTNSNSDKSKSSAVNNNNNTDDGQNHSNSQKKVEQRKTEKTESNQIKVSST